MAPVAEAVCINERVAGVGLSLRRKPRSFLRDSLQPRPPLRYPQINSQPHPRLTCWKVQRHLNAEPFSRRLRHVWSERISSLISRHESFGAVSNKGFALDLVAWWLGGLVAWLAGWLVGWLQDIERWNRRAAPLSLRPTCAHRARIIDSSEAVQGPNQPQGVSPGFAPDPQEPGLTPCGWWGSTETHHLS